jgi:hypothetical protein
MAAHEGGFLMAKRRGKRSLANASIATLERTLARRKREVVRLEKKRDALGARLARAEADLAALQGGAVSAAPAARPGKRRKRRQRKTSLAAAISQALKDAGKPMRAADVTEAVLAAGYTTRAKNFKQIVHSALTRHPDAKRIEKGLYVFKGRCQEEARQAGAPKAKEKGGPCLNQRSRSGYHRPGAGGVRMITCARPAVPLTLILTLPLSPAGRGM